MDNCGKSNGNVNLELNDNGNRKKIVAREINKFLRGAFENSLKEVIGDDIDCADNISFLMSTPVEKICEEARRIEETSNTQQ
jgi:hypothetical protein